MSKWNWRSCCCSWSCCFCCHLSWNYRKNDSKTRGSSRSSSSRSSSIFINFILILLYFCFDLVLFLPHLILLGRWPSPPPPDNGHGTRLWRSRRPGTSHFFAILGCTDLRIGVSGAKFDARADFEVRLPPAPPKPPENIEKLREIFEKKLNFFGFFFEFVLKKECHYHCCRFSHSVFIFFSIFFFNFFVIFFWKK